MAHSDDKGLVLPPRLAPIEVVIVPIFKNETKDAVVAFARKLRDTLAPDFRVLLDEDDQNTPGWKFSEYEVQGIPVRLELGPRDMEKGQVVAVRRDTGEKAFVPVAEAACATPRHPRRHPVLPVQARAEVPEDNTFRRKDYAELAKLLDDPGGFIEAGWCGDAACEARVKEETKATIRLLPTRKEGHGRCSHAWSAERTLRISRSSAARTDRRSLAAFAVSALFAPPARPPVAQHRAGLRGRRPRGFNCSQGRSQPVTACRLPRPWRAAPGRYSRALPTWPFSTAPCTAP